jgi:hypothetical protein
MLENNMPMHRDYRAQWVAAGYSSEMGSAEVCLPPAREFIRVYHLMPPEYALAAISLGRLKVARFSDVNDPFELLALGLKGDHRRQVMRNFKNAMDKKQGILSFSGNWTNPVLWSHYANRHRGICLGFNLRRSKAEAITYEDERIRQELDDDKHSMHLTREQEILLRRTKYSHWEYEEEHRLFVDLEKSVQEGPLHFWNFDDDLVLTEVILGVNSRLPLDKVRSLTAGRYAHVLTYGARLAVKSFGIVPDEPTVP